jgi:cell division protein FtsQ
MNSKAIKVAFMIVNLVFLLVVFEFFSYKGSKIACQNINVVLRRTAYNAYLPVSEQEIISLLQADASLDLGNASIKQISGEYIERLIKKNIFIKDVIVYKDYKGSLTLEVLSRNPIARLIDKGGRHMYIDREGFIMPIVPKYTHRLMIVYDSEGYYLNEKSTQSYYSIALLSLLHYISNDKFLNANVESLEIGMVGDINVNLQVGNQVVEFGQPDDIKKKFNKLALFYTQILPHTEWNKYKKVNLKFDKQIVCELT